MSRQPVGRVVRGSILPTRNLAVLIFVLAVIWYAAANQSNAPAYLLLFALASIFLISIPHTSSNLSGLIAKAESPKPVFAGSEVSLPIELVNQSRILRRGVHVQVEDQTGSQERADEVPGAGATRIVLRFPALTRGEHPIDTICLTSAYPLGFVKAKRSIPARQHFLVYPKPAGDPKLPVNRNRHNRGSNQPEVGEGDDFAGVRGYIPGESQRHIDWKAVARGQPMMTKQFTTETSGALFLDFTAARFANVEQRLSQLTLWVIEAERSRRPYGLHLPGLEIQPSLGDSHFHRCLRALALFR
jgi:uncharacterized protein (DUF58 family)